MAQAGFILTRHWRDTPQGTEVSFWLVTDSGPLQVTLAPQESVAFIPADQVPRAQHILQGEQGFRLTPLALKDFHRQPEYGALHFLVTRSGSKKNFRPYSLN